LARRRHCRRICRDAAVTRSVNAAKESKEQTWQRKKNERNGRENLGRNVGERKKERNKQDEGRYSYDCKRNRLPAEMSAHVDPPPPRWRRGRRTHCATSTPARAPQRRGFVRPPAYLGACAERKENDDKRSRQTTASARQKSRNPDDALRFLPVLRRFVVGAVAVVRHGATPYRQNGDLS